MKEHVPTVLVNNKNMYGIVSKGIHELNEEESITMYPYIKAGIELILDDTITEKERAIMSIIQRLAIIHKSRI